jgi:voltage-gated sodium channel
MSIFFGSPEYGNASGDGLNNGPLLAHEIEGPPDELLELAAKLTQVNPLEKAPLGVRFILGPTFEIFTAVVIMANVVVIGMETEHPEMAEYWQKVQLVFLGFFAVEVTLRIFAEGVLAGVELDPPRCVACAFFQGPFQLLGNHFDFAVVVLGCADAAMMSLHMSKKGGVSGLFTLLRCLRILRILRMLRVVRTLAPNSYRLLEALVKAFQVLRWILILFVVIIVLSAVVYTNVARDFVDDPEVTEEIQLFWGGVFRSCISLFQVVTLDDWATITNCITRHSVWIYLSMVVFIILTSFTVMSLLTGVISDNVIETAAEEEDENKRKAARDRMLFAEALRALYDRANDRDNFNGVTRSALADVVSHFNHPALKDKMDGLSLPYKDVERASQLKKILENVSSTAEGEGSERVGSTVITNLAAPAASEQEHPLLRLFDLLDTDRSGDLDWMELRAGLSCPAEGEVLSKDMLAFEAECRRFALQLQRANKTNVFKNSEGSKLVQDSIGLAQAITLKFQESTKSVDAMRKTLR